VEKEKGGKGREGKGREGRGGKSKNKNAVMDMDGTAKTRSRT
jgi:hypothetical protein